MRKRNVATSIHPMSVVGTDSRNIVYSTAALQRSRRNIETAVITSSRTEVKGQKLAIGSAHRRTTAHQRSDLDTSSGAEPVRGRNGLKRWRRAPRGGSLKQEDIRPIQGHSYVSVIVVNRNILFYCTVYNCLTVKFSYKFVL